MTLYLYINTRIEWVDEMWKGVWLTLTQTTKGLVLVFHFINWDTIENCPTFMVYWWLKWGLILVSPWCYSVSLSCMSATCLDMSLILLWACMLSSHLSPQNFSTVTLRTVPWSRQCGAMPGDKSTVIKVNTLFCMWKNSNWFLCFHVIISVTANFLFKFLIQHFSFKYSVEVVHQKQPECPSVSTVI